MVRTPQAADVLAPFSVTTRKADYTDPASLDAALTGIDRVLLISSSVLGKRAAHHKNVIEAAMRSSVSLIAYTSILRADTSELSLAAEHLATEKMLRETGLPYVLLRNGWYLENDTAMLAPAVANGAIIGSAGDGRLSSASRSNYAEAAALVLLHGAPAGTIYELAGDEAFTLTQLAASVSQRTGKTVGYRNMSEVEYRAALLGMGLPDAWDRSAVRCVACAYIRLRVWLARAVLCAFNNCGAHRYSDRRTVVATPRLCGPPKFTARP